MKFSRLKRILLLKFFLLILTFCILISGLYAQTEYDFPAGDYWALHFGAGMTNFVVAGTPLQVIIDPRLWLSPSLTVGSRVGISYSFEEKSAYSDILNFEGQVYLRWNFLRFGHDPIMVRNVFFQGGLGLMATYRGNDNVFDDPTVRRGSLLVDAMLGINIPITDRWSAEASIRGGLPHIWGFSITAGYKFPLPQKTIWAERVEYIDRTPPASELASRIIIPSIEFVIFGPDIGSYNVGIDADARQLNELVLNATAQMLNENSSLRVRIEGHANPHTINISEAEDLMALSTMRANVVADQLRARGVRDEQIILIAFGGTRTATNEWDVRNRNRRVELMIIQFEEN